jgi:hypothetical protein
VYRRRARPWRAGASRSSGAARLRDELGVFPAGGAGCAPPCNRPVHSRRRRSRDRFGAGCGRRRIEATRVGAVVVRVTPEDRHEPAEIAAQVVRARRGDRIAEPVANDPRPDRHRAEVGRRDSLREVWRPAYERDGERIPARRDARDVCRLPPAVGAQSGDVGDGWNCRCVRAELRRSIEYLNVCAVTSSFEGGEKRKPERIRKV